ncbi:MAG: ATP synthase F0 subunit B [Oligoflexia bacterium]|nr:ATP synthase F0 subunit B [Oligoflexia bacterium]
MEEILKAFDLNTTDATMILVWMVFFFGIWKLLAKTLIGPFVKLVEAREAATSGALERAAKISSDAEKFEENYRNRIATAKAKISQENMTLLIQARKEGAEQLEKAEKEIQQQTQARRRELGEKMLRIKQEINTEVDVIARQLVSKVSGSPNLN